MFNSLKSSFMTRLLLSFVLSFALVTSSALASSGGITGQTRFNGTGCGSCHGQTSSASTTLRVRQAVDNKITVARGQTIELEVIVANATRPFAGINLGVKSTLNGTQNSGVLTAITGAGLRKLSNELTHSSPKAMSSGETSFTFTWTAPDEDGVHFLHASGNAVNRNGNSEGDLWNYLQPVEISVSGVNSVFDEQRVAFANVAPMPAFSFASVSGHATAGELFSVRIIDVAGTTVLTDAIAVADETFTYTWPLRSASGALVAPGSYLVILSNEKRVIRGKVVVIH